MLNRIRHFEIRWPIIRPYQEKLYPKWCLEIRGHALVFRQHSAADDQVA